MRILSNTSRNYLLGQGWGKKNGGDEEIALICPFSIAWVSFFNSGRMGPDPSQIVMLQTKLCLLYTSNSCVHSDTENGNSLSLSF